MTDPIEILMQEHKDVLEIVDNIGRLQQELKDTPDETAPKLKELLAKLDKEFDIHSLSKEEKALFPAMETFMPRDEGPIGVMIQEHVELVRRIQDYKESLDTGDYNKSMEAGAYLISVLPDHIYKEDNILYNMARMHLSSDDMDGIYQKMLDIEKNKEL
ncbi:MAG: hemerythrin domain-containing protein [Deltaproteobacteria bacterium]|nr:hemerythrin domain-containing protein [Deltaproteobacteria bacterium]